MLISIDVVGQEELERPVERDAETPLEGGELEQVVRPPHEPGDEAGHLDASDLAHPPEPAERHEHALLAVVERVGGRPSSTARTLRAAWGPSRTACWAVAGDGRPVPGSMIDAQSPSAQTRSSPGTANVASGRIQPRESSAPSTPAKPAKAGFGALPTVLITVAVAMTLPSSSSHPVGLDAGQASTEDQPDSCAHQLLCRVSAEAIAKLRQDVGPAVDEHDIRFREAGKRPMRGAQQVLELGGNFDAGRAAAHDDEREERVAPSRVGLVGRFLELGQGPVAKVEGVAEGPHADRVLGHPGHRSEVGDASERDHERVVRDAEDLTALPAPDRDVLWTVSISST